MNPILTVILVIVISPIVGCLFAGIDRKISAHLQSRVGPPLLQPFYDFRKLMSKENIVVTKYQNLYILTYFVFIVASEVMMFLRMDLLMILFVFTIANVALIIGAISTGSPYAKIGGHREIMAMLAYEPVLIFFIVGMYMLTGSFNISEIGNISMPLIAYLPLIFIAMLFIMLIKFKKSPFDLSASHHAHQELVKGMLTEFSGPSLAMIELTHWYESTILLGFMFLFWGQNIIMGVVIAILTYLFVIIVDNISARLSWGWLLKFTWTIVIGLSIVNILVLYLYNVRAV